LPSARQVSPNQSNDPSKVPIPTALGMQWALLSPMQLREAGERMSIIG